MVSDVTALGRCIVFILALAVLAASCSSTTEVAAERAPSTVPTTAGDQTPVSEATAVAPAATPLPLPTIVPTATAIPEPTATPTSTPVPPTPQPLGPCDVGPLAVPNPDRPIYDAQISVDPATRTVVGSVAVDFTPDLPIEELFVRLWPNGPRTASGGVSMELTNAAIESLPVAVEMLDPTTARIPLSAPAQAGDTVRLELSFELVVPNELKSRLSGRGDYMRLGTILPILPWEPGLGWALDPATSLFAESVSSPVADYAVRVDVPDGFDVLASGVVDADGTWRVEAARDFSLSVGRFRTLTGTAMAPEPVQVTVGIHETIDDDPQVYLNKIIDSLEQFSSRWGQYPWPSLTFAVTPNLSGGIEFPTHIMQGPNTQGRVTSHEVGHMFFYSLVGNNQGAAPWLDEGIASYAEFTYEGTAANAFAIPAGGIGNATEPMTFWEPRADIYYRSVYAQVGFALQNLGSQEDVDCALARYVAANAHRIATAQDFVAAFEPTFPDIVERMATFGVNLNS